LRYPLPFRPCPQFQHAPELFAHPRTALHAPTHGHALSSKNNMCVELLADECSSDLDWRAPSCDAVIMVEVSVVYLHNHVLMAIDKGRLT